MKVLAVTPEPIDADALRDALGDDARDAEVKVVAPALNESPAAFWVSDSDEAIAEAEQAQEESVRELRSEGVEATGESGEADPLLAVQDALVTFPADRVVVFLHPEQEQRYREADIAGEVERRFGRPAVYRVLHG
ncbi:MAG: hypothetical protein JWN32_3331 [Solirubrobacterales bacterium]|nr:hypothetical protein [Solirubrobacterales bacterium]